MELSDHEKITASFGALLTADWTYLNPQSVVVSSLIVKRVTAHPLEITDGIPKNEESEQHHSNNIRLILLGAGDATPPLNHSFFIISSRGTGGDPFV